MFERLTEVRVAGSLCDRQAISVAVLPTELFDGSLAFRHLRADEQAEAERFQQQQRRHCFAVTRAALRILLAAKAGLRPADVIFARDSFGRPQAQHVPLSYSVSHTGTMSLIAIGSGRRLGIDIEARRPVPEADRIAARIFGDDAATRLAQFGAERTDLFLQLWTAGEAFAKATGLGLAGHGGRLPVGLTHEGQVVIATYQGTRWRVSPLDLSPGHVASLVSEATESMSPEIDVMRLEPGSLDRAA